jgi:AsmA protein
LKAIKYAIYTVLVLLALAIAGVAIFAVTFDPNRYKDDVERLVAERTGRTLKLSGNLAVAFWPSLGAKVGGVTLSERGRDDQFLSLEGAHASVAVMPLLRGEVIVDSVTVSGLKAQVVRDKDGRFNFQDLLGEEKPKAQPSPAPDKKAGSGQPVAFDIAGVTVERSSVSYRDLASGQEFALDDFNLEVATASISRRSPSRSRGSTRASPAPRRGSRTCS